MAVGQATFSGAAGAVGDLFAASGYKYKAQGALLEKENYLKAADLAGENERFTEQSQAIKQTQLDRSIYQSTSGTQADTAGGGLAASGSALDILHDSASQGALTKQVLAEQGYITEAGYKEQQESYQTMAKAAQVAADAANEASDSSMITGIIKGIGAIASIGLAPFTGGASLAIGAGVTAGLDGLAAIH